MESKTVGSAHLMKLYDDYIMYMKNIKSSNDKIMQILQDTVLNIYTSFANIICIYLTAKYNSEILKYFIASVAVNKSLS